MEQEQEQEETLIHEIRFEYSELPRELRVDK